MSQSNKQVAHIWAQNEGKNAKGSNFYCVDNKLFSYATCVGFIEKGVAFLSYNRMSVSTGKQLGYARNALKNGNLILFSPAFKYGNGYAPTVKECIISMVEKLNEDFTAIEKAKSNMPWLLDRYVENRSNLIIISKKFKVRINKLPIATKSLKERALEITEKNKQREKARKEKNRLAGEVKAGCHTFSPSEIERFVTKWGLK